MLLAALTLTGCRTGGGDGGSEGSVFRFGNQVPSPDPAIAELAAVDTMTREAQRTFFTAAPQLRARAGFTLNCPAKEKRQILGCYINGKIYILRVDDPELAPVMQVTAAHEMLHAAYADLSSREQKRIDSLTAAYYKTSEDKELIEIVEHYPAADRVNELHSLLGTQVEDLPDELEKHYALYFRDRGRVVEAHAKADAVFDGIEARYQELIRQIDALAEEIDGLTVEQNKQAYEASRLSTQIDVLRAQNHIEESNRLVPKQNAAADETTRLQARIVLLTNDHNAKVREINDLVFRQDELIKSLSAV